jgi:hypothetical protein
VRSRAAAAALFCESLFADGQGGRRPNLTAALGARLPVFRIVNSGPGLREPCSLVQGADHQGSVTLVVRRVGHETGNVDPALSADQEIDGLHREFITAEQLGIVDRYVERAIRIGNGTRLVLTAEGALTCTRYRVFRRNTGFVLDLDVPAMAAAG